MRASNAAAQNRTPNQQLGDVNPLLETGRTGEAERLLRQLVPKPEEEAVREPGMFSFADVHDLLVTQFANGGR